MTPLRFVLCFWLVSALASSARAQGDALHAEDKLDDGVKAELGGSQRTLSGEALAALQARYAREPKISDVVAAAVRAERRDPRRFADMASRARLRGLLPHLDLGARRGQGVDLRWTTSDELDANRTTADDVMLFATLRFDLDRLLFAGEEVSIAREERFTRQARHELIRQVVHVYFLRRRLLLERDLLGETSIGHELQIAEAEALLEAFTDGAFQRMLSRAASAWKTGASTNASERQ